MCKGPRLSYFRQLFERRNVQFTIFRVYYQIIRGNVLDLYDYSSTKFTSIRHQIDS